MYLENIQEAVQQKHTWKKKLQKQTDVKFLQEQSNWRY